MSSNAQVKTPLPPAPAPKKESNFLIDFLMGGVSAAIAKTAASPIERVKLLIDLVLEGEIQSLSGEITDNVSSVTSPE